MESEAVSHLQKAPLQAVGFALLSMSAQVVLRHAMQQNSSLHITASVQHQFLC